MSFTAVSLFSGCGLFDIGIQQAGFDIVLQVEKWRAASKVLHRHWPKIEKKGDIRDVKNFPKADLVFGGFPCQDLSSLGNKRGLAGEQSGLWCEFVRAVCDIQPKIAILENVPELASNGLSEILSAFAKIGLDAEWCTLRASQFGLPHKKERLFVIAYPGQVGWQADHGEGTYAPSPLKTECHAGRSGKPKQTTCAFPKSFDARRGFDDSAARSRNGKLNPDFVEALMGAPIGYTDNCGLSDRQRIELLGNAVAVPVAKFVGECAKNFIERKESNGVLC